MGIPWRVAGLLVTEDADYQTVASTEGVARTDYAEDTDHGFPS